MTALLENVLQASFHGSIVIACVLLLRLVLKKAPKKYICWLWLMAGLRLLMPIPIKSELSLQPKGIAIRLPDWNTMAILAVLWLAIACCFGIYCLVSYRRLKRQVQEAVRIRGGWESDRIDTAFILGFIKPRIYIPMGMSKESRKYILEHERTHLDKGDHWIKMIGFLALALHWFNPLVWIAYKLLCKDIEMACDERVVQFMELEERKGYSAALLNCSTSHTHFASPVAFGEISVKERVMTVLNYKKPGFWISLISLIAIAFVAVCLLTSPTGEEEIPMQTLSPQEQAELDLLQACHGDMEAALSQEEFSFNIVGTNTQGHTIWYTELFRLGEDTIWTYTANSPMPNDGRMELQGRHYATQNGQWIETDSADEGFETWLDVFRWDMATAALVEEAPTETGKKIVFTTQYQKDNALHTATMDYRYGEDGSLGCIIVENPNQETAATVILDLSMPVFPGQPGVTAESTFAEVEGMIVEGFVTGEELQEQAEYDAWGVMFRVDDDRLSDSGADVYIGQDAYGRGTLATTEKYWLEKKVGDTWERVPTIGDANWNLTEMGIAKEQSTFGYLDWTPLYGKLPSGTYRMGKTVRCTDYPADYNKTHTFYSEFTVYSVVDSQSPEAAAAVERCYNAVEALKQQDTIHYLVTSGTWNTAEVWWDQGDYVSITTWLEESWERIPENEGRVDILVRQDGIGYDKVLADPEDRGSEIIGMQLSTLDADWAGWEISFAEEGDVMFFERDNKRISFPEGIGVVSDEMVRFCQNWKNSGSDEELVAQLTYKFDENGNLVYMEYAPLYDETPTVFTIEILPTTPAEVDAKVQGYIDQLMVGSFSWAEAQEKYTDEEFNIRQSGFVNNDVDPITDAVDAAKRALKEYPNLGDYLSIAIFHDDAAGMWKVTIESYYEYQASEEYRDIYIADNGVTCLLVYEGPICSWDGSTRK